MNFSAFGIKKAENQGGIMKRLIAGLSLVCSLLLSVNMFAACGGDGSSQSGGDSGEITLRFWNGFTGLDGDSMDEMIKDFNDEYAGEIKVSADKMAWDTLFTKITTTKTNLKSAPHIVAMSNSRVAGMVERDLLLPIDDIASVLGVTQEDYIASAWSTGILDGKRYSFPLDIHPTAMYYNKDLITEEELPATWEEFLAVCEEKTDPETGVYGFAVPSMYSITKDIFASMLLQNGGDLYDSENTAVYNSQEGVEALQYLCDLVYKYGVSPKDVGAGGDYTLFKTGKSVFYFDGPWMLNSFDLIENRETANVGVAAMPGAVGENGVSYSGSHQFTLMSNTVTDDRTKEACYTFIKYIQQHSLGWAKAGQVPALKEVLDSEEYKSIAALQPFTETAYKADLGKADYKYFYEGYNYMGVAVSNAISDKYGPKDSLDRAVKSFSNWIIDNGF